MRSRTSLRTPDASPLHCANPQSKSYPRSRRSPDKIYPTAGTVSIDVEPLTHRPEGAVPALYTGTALMYKCKCALRRVNDFAIFEILFLSRNHLGVWIVEATRNSLRLSPLVYFRARLTIAESDVVKILSTGLRLVVIWWRKKLTACNVPSTCCVLASRRSVDLYMYPQSLFIGLP